ncbi:plasmid stabilization protein [Candidatus Peregrinibacteria bacterium]|nr:plasmid stabilization protein [Candidatus Peregrinibacteria bacterium]
MAKLIFTESYEKRAKEFLRRHSELKNQYAKVIKLLSINPYHPSLRLHRLHGKLSMFYSVSINISYRITLQFLINKDTIIPIHIGKHEEVY